MATLDVLTLDEAKAAISNNAGETNDELLAVYVTAMSQFVDTLIGPVIKRTVIGEAHDGGEKVVFLDNRPVFSVESVTEYDSLTANTLTEQTPGTAPADGFVRERGGVLTRTRSGSRCSFRGGVQNVIVSYTAGRVAATSLVDKRIKLAAGYILESAWRHSKGMGSNTDPAVIATYSLPNAARTLLGPDLLVNL